MRVEGYFLSKNLHLFHKNVSDMFRGTKRIIKPKENSVLACHHPLTQQYLNKYP